MVRWWVSPNRLAHCASLTCKYVRAGRQVRLSNRWAVLLSLGHPHGVTLLSFLGAGLGRSPESEIAKCHEPIQHDRDLALRLAVPCLQYSLCALGAAPPGLGEVSRHNGSVRIVDSNPGALTEVAWPRLHIAALVRHGVVRLTASDPGPRAL